MYYTSIERDNFSDLLAYLFLRIDMKLKKEYSEMYYLHVGNIQIEGTVIFFLDFNNYVCNISSL